jgi:hypothetical protein
MLFKYVGVAECTGKKPASGGRTVTRLRNVSPSNTGGNQVVELPPVQRRIKPVPAAQRRRRRRHRPRLGGRSIKFLI